MSTTFDLSSAIANLTPGRPLLIVDADEVLLKFVDGFDKYLRREGLYLDLTSYRLHGNVKRVDDNRTILDVEVTALLDEFRRDLDSLEIVEGADDALRALKPRLDIVVLTNISEAQGIPRRRNLAGHGLHLPLVANSGAKGPAVRALSASAGRPVFFVDDIPQHLTSCADAAPDALRIHLIGDDRLKPLLPPPAAAHLRAENWRDAHAFIDSALTRAGH